MECNQVPSAGHWQKYSERQIQEFRSHLHFCRACRKRVLEEAPEEMLFELKSGPALPEDFWLGFWDSLEKKLPAPATTAAKPPLPVHRWAAVFVICCLLVFTYQDLSESPSSSRGGPQMTRPYIISKVDPSTYPLVERVDNPNATYYIIQPSGSNEKIVLLFDPDLEL